MKQNPNYIMCEISGMNILVPVGAAIADFNGVISLGGIGGDIWTLLEKDMSRDELLEKILEEYDVPREKAAEDIDRFLEILRVTGCLEE